MDTERWARLKQIFTGALERPADERSAFLDEACGEDAALRQEVDRLLAEQDAPSLRSPAGGWLRAAAPPELAPGETIAHYRVEQRLGEGGMGVVYRAYDAHLHRSVALKVLPPQHFADPERKVRLVREARAASALNHPNILTVHDIGSDRGLDFIVMEYVEGLPLDHLIPPEGLPLETALGYAVQIAGALAKAHAAGVIHRDLKPRNIMVTREGLVKLLDFGLARRLDFGDEHEASLTVEGGILGTPSYMSPEQSEGRKADARSDVFSFGAVLYEMLAGRRAFAGLAREEPKPLKDVTPDLQRVVTRCLRRNPADRFQTAAELKSALERTDHEAPCTPSIAVLPFANPGADKENEYFSDGLAEEILNALAQVPGLRVMARSSSFYFRGKDVDIREIASRLNVGHILEGSVRRAGDRIRVTVQLVNAADGCQLWSERYERQMAGVFEVQDEISQAVVNKLRVQLVGQQTLIQRQAPNLEAYNLYLRGRHWGNQFTGHSWRKAIECFERAIAEDPNYASPHAGLAVAYTYLAIHGWARPRDVMPSAKTFALKALELDGTLGEAHFALGFIRTFYEWDWCGAESEYRRAMELNPRDALIRIYFATLLMYTGRAEAAFAEARRAWELEPVSEEVNRMLVYISFVTGRYDEAVAHGQKAVELYPHGAGAHNLLGFAHIHKGRYQDAVRSLQEASTLTGGDPLFEWGLGYGYARLGRRREALAIVERLEPRRSKGYFPPTLIAGLYGALGELDRAFQFLETAYEERDGFLVTIGVDPTHGSLRSDPRCHALLKKLGLA